MASNGNAIAVWEHDDGNLFASLYTVGMGWGAAIPISNVPAHFIACSPQVAINSNGNAIVVWFQENQTTKLD